MRQKRNQQRQSTSELTARFQSFSITEARSTLYNEVPFKPDELLYSSISCRRTDPNYWQKFQDKIFNLRESIQSTNINSQTMENLQQMKQTAFQIKSEIKESTFLNTTHQANMVRKINILIKKILSLLQAPSPDIPLDSSTTSIPIISRTDHSLYRYFIRPQKVASANPWSEPSQSQSSGLHDQSEQSCIFNSND